VKLLRRIPPYFWLAVLYLSFIAAWTALIMVAVRHAPEPVPLETTAARHAR